MHLLGLDEEDTRLTMGDALISGGFGWPSETLMSVDAGKSGAAFATLASLRLQERHETNGADVSAEDCVEMTSVEEDATGVGECDSGKSTGYWLSEDSGLERYSQLSVKADWESIAEARTCSRHARVDEEITCPLIGCELDSSFISTLLALPESRSEFDGQGLEINNNLKINKEKFINITAFIYIRVNTVTFNL